MPITLLAADRKALLASIKRFMAERLETDIGDLKASLLLDYILQEIAPSVYNRAIADAQEYFQQRTEDLGGVRHEPEFAYWPNPAR